MSSYHCNPNAFIVRFFEEDAVLFHKANGSTHHLPPLASYLLGELLRSPASYEVLTGALLDDDEDRGILSSQIDETLDDLCRLGLISRHP